MRVGVADEARGLARAYQRRAGPVEGYADLDRVGPTQDEQGIAQIDPPAHQRIGAGRQHHGAHRRPQGEIVHPSAQSARLGRLHRPFRREPRHLTLGAPRPRLALPGQQGVGRPGGGLRLSLECEIADPDHRRAGLHDPAFRGQQLKHDPRVRGHQREP